MRRFLLLPLLASLLLCIGCAKDAAKPYTPHETTPSEDSGVEGDDTALTDADGDGYAADADCDDDDPAVNPGAAELCNGIDDDCDGETDEGFRAPYCTPDGAPCPMAATPAEPAIPVLHLPFEASDPTANLGSLADGDYSARLFEAYSTDGAIGGGLGFAISEGSEQNDYLEIGAADALKVETFTAAAWVWPHYIENRAVIMSEMATAPSRGISFEAGWGALSLALGDGMAEYYWSVPISTEQWSHLAATFDGDVVSLYVDGQLRLREHVDERFLGIEHRSDYDLMVGTFFSPLYYPFQGVLDELRLYDRALTQAEIRRELLSSARYRFESPGAAADHGPHGIDEADGGQDRSTTCGPVGAAWLREADEPAVLLEAHEQLALNSRATVRAWARPDALSDTMLVASQEDAWSLGIQDSSWTWSVHGDDGSTSQLSAEAIAGLWTEVVGSFDGVHASLYLDGELVADRVTGFHDLASGTGLSMGEGWVGALDEVELLGVALRAADVRAGHLCMASYDFMDVNLDSSGVTDAGPLALDLRGQSIDTTDDDALYPCLKLQAEDRQACPHRSGEGKGLSSAEVQLRPPLTVEALLKADASLSGAVTLLEGPDLVLLATASDLELQTSLGTISAPLDPGAWRTIAAVAQQEALQLYIDGALAAEQAVEADAPGPCPKRPSAPPPARPGCRSWRCTASPGTRTRCAAGMLPGTPRPIPSWSASPTTWICGVRTGGSPRPTTR